MTKEELTKLDNYGHKEIASLDKDQLKEYAMLLDARYQEVFNLLPKKGGRNGQKEKVTSPSGSRR